ncbi:hypothetical protein [Paludisphaera mucosa]|uniref:Uncharacterized protein n=1 Tax=Paludisphaera mucosa TaxID=3030827 RepID=A0ABT6F6W9_9BACT|nr:hypothetical protein [Paludisphaera mucosa]MDG3003269.1 hypothetical protein [Paludisphaera mucosa]
MSRTQGYWRRIARDAVAAAMAEAMAAGLSGRDLERAVRRRCPFSRSNHPYRVWLEEVRFQLEGRCRSFPSLVRTRPTAGRISLQLIPADSSSPPHSVARGPTRG